MATRSTRRSREEIELKLLAFELVERKAQLALHVLVTLIAAITALVCVLRAYPWPSSSAAGIVCTLAIALGRRRRVRSVDRAPRRAPLIPRSKPPRC
jgi:hypothetical protein